MYLGIDLGTSELKLLLLDAAHRIVATTGEPLSVQRPRPLWSEQQPDDWWAATERAMQRLRAEQAPALAAVRAIGLSGQMHGAVLIDINERVLRPAILWNDGRSAAQCAQLEHAVPELHAITGNLAMPGFTAPKLLWVREHEPEVFERTACVLLPKDWLRLELTGERVSDCSDAAGTLWLDVGRRRWSDTVLAACGLGIEQMPRLVEGSEVSGHLKTDLAQRWGLRAGIAVAGGGGDNAASAVGMGTVAPGQGFVSLGTSGVIFVSTDRFRPNPAQALHAFCHALPRRWHQMSVMLSAASAVSWAAKAFGFAGETALIDAAAGVDDAARQGAPLFLPYLSGERTPHNNPHAQGVLFGLTHAHDRGAIAYAVVEGVSFGLLDGYRTLAVPTETPVRELSAVGGGARSAWWVQLLADVLQVPLVTHQGSAAGGALGAARLAWLADGGSEAEVCRLPPVLQRFEPRAALRDLFAARHQRFMALYPSVKAQFGSLGLHFRSSTTYFQAASSRWLVCAYRQRLRAIKALRSERVNFHSNGRAMLS